MHNRVHLHRAILECLVYSISKSFVSRRKGKERIEKRSGQTITRVRASGGGLQSDAALQITANVYNLPTEQPHLYETSGLGVAVGLKLHSDFTAAVAAMSRVGQVFVPDPAHVQTYEQLYRRVYCRMYQRLQPLYHDIAAITGDDAG